jgi:hypothetical protein
MEPKASRKAKERRMVLIGFVGYNAKNGLLVPPPEDLGKTLTICHMW